MDKREKLFAQKLKQIGQAPENNELRDKKFVIIIQNAANFKYLSEVLRIIYQSTESESLKKQFLEQQLGKLTTINLLYSWYVFNNQNTKIKNTFFNELKEYEHELDTIYNSSLDQPKDFVNVVSFLHFYWPLAKAFVDNYHPEQKAGFIVSFFPKAVEKNEVISLDIHKPAAIEVTYNFDNEVWETAIKTDECIVDHPVFRKKELNNLVLTPLIDSLTNMLKIDKREE